MNDNTQRAQFERDGFLVCENILDAATVDCLNLFSDTVLAEQDALTRGAGSHHGRSNRCWVLGVGQQTSVYRLWPQLGSKVCRWSGNLTEVYR